VNEKQEGILHRIDANLERMRVQFARLAELNWEIFALFSETSKEFEALLGEAREARPPSEKE